MDKEKTYKETPKQKKSASGIWAWILCILLAAIGTIAAIGTQKIWDVVGLLLEQRDCRGPGSPECRTVGIPIDIRKRDSKSSIRMVTGNEERRIEE